MKADHDDWVTEDSGDIPSIPGATFNVEGYSPRGCNVVFDIPRGMPKKDPKVQRAIRDFKMARDVNSLRVV